MTQNNKVKIYVDADACPVKQEIVEVANRNGVDITFVASYAHLTNQFQHLTWKYVDSDPEAVDLFIINHAKNGDVVITQDIGLASVLVNRNIYTISPRGKIFHKGEMELALQLRYYSAKERRSGKYAKGPKAFSMEDKITFRTTLEKILSEIEGIF